MVIEGKTFKQTTGNWLFVCFISSFEKYPGIYSIDKTHGVAWRSTVDNYKTTCSGMEYWLCLSLSLCFQTSLRAPASTVTPRTFQRLWWSLALPPPLLPRPALPPRPPSYADSCHMTKVNLTPDEYAVGCPQHLYDYVLFIVMYFVLLPSLFILSV